MPTLIDLISRYARLSVIQRRVVVPMAMAALLLALVAVPFVMGIGFDHFKDWLEQPAGPLPFSIWAALLFAVLSVVNAIIGNWAYQHFVDWQNQRVPAVGEFFRNHHLTRLVGQSIGMVIREAAEDKALPPADQDTLLALARCAEQDWPQRVTRFPLLAQDWLAPLQDRRLVEFIRKPDALALTDEQAGNLLRFINPADGQPPVFQNPATETTLHLMLRRRFSVALREGLKRDFARRGEASYGMLLDIAGEMLQAGASGLASTTENRAAIKAALQSLQAVNQRLVKLDRNFDRHCTFLAKRLEDLEHVIREEGKQSAKRDAETHEGIAELKAQNEAIAALLREALTPKQLGEDPTQKTLSPELIEQAKMLLERGDKEQQALAEIALKHHQDADKLIQELKQEPLAEAFRLLTLEGTNWYNAGEFDKAIPPFEKALALQPDNTDARNWAAIAHGQARLGDIAAHQQRAIALLMENLTLLPERTLEWAGGQNNLGTAWREMPIGDKAENLCKAISAYTAALKVYTRQDHPAHWALTQNNLGNAWADMPKGDKASNLGKAIDAYTAALAVRTLQANPVDWARTQNNLGTAWANMPMGDRTENLGKAIAAYTAALEIRTRQAHPVDWAAIQINLGNAWLRMPTSNKAENLSKAITAYTVALEILDRQNFPVHWAMTQNNLGAAWQEMPIGDIAENLGKTIAAFTAALEVYTRQAHPMDWAQTQNNLGAAWAQMPKGDKAENQGKAIAAFTAVLEVYTRKAHPVDWAISQNNLGEAWRNMPTGDKAENLNKAIAAYTAALEVRTRQAHPVDWAMTHFNLGLAFWQRAKFGGGCMDWCNAIAEVKAAAEVWTAAAFPFDYQNHIAPALEQLRKDWQKAGCEGQFDDIPPAL